MTLSHFMRLPVEMCELTKLSFKAHANAPRLDRLAQSFKSLLMTDSPVDNSKQSLPVGAP